ncbi:MAG: hypothetical protein ACRET7_00215 [Burkholderiales bacterium]
MIANAIGPQNTVGAIGLDLHDENHRVLRDHADQREDVAAVAHGDREPHRRLAVDVEERQRRVGEAAPDLGDVAQRHEPVECTKPWFPRHPPPRSRSVDDILSPPSLQSAQGAGCAPVEAYRRAGMQERRNTFRGRRIMSGVGRARWLVGGDRCRTARAT